MRYACGFPGYETSNAQGIVVFAYEIDAMAYLKALRKNELASFVVKKENVSWQYVKDSEWSEVSLDQKKWILATNEGGKHPVFKLTDTKITYREERLSESFDKMDIDAIGQGNTITLETPTVLTQMGLTIYGESLPDLKKMAIRWQYCTSAVAFTCKQPKPSDCDYFCKIPVRPRRTLNTSFSGAYDNRVRDGQMTVINSGFYT